MRTIPRDLFNQANLLENLGHLYIELETIAKENILVDEDPERDSFEMSVDGYSNSQSIKSIFIKVNGENQSVYRYINSRERYSLYCMDMLTEEEIEVFDKDGKLSTDFLEYAVNEKEDQELEIKSSLGDEEYQDNLNSNPKTKVP